MRIRQEVLTSSGQLPSDDSPAYRTRSQVRADYMAATRAQAIKQSFLVSILLVSGQKVGFRSFFLTLFLIPGEKSHQIEKQKKIMT